ncbi:MAG: uroporphyrinogen decarboxylase family protein [Planctomycetota bacterium]
MNAKERVSKALRREVPDKVPYGEFAIDYDTVERILGRKTYLRNKAGIATAVWEGRYDEMAESVAEDHLALVEALDQDIISASVLPPREGTKPKRIDDTTYEYADGRVMKYSPTTNDFTVVHWPDGDYLPTDEDIERMAEGIEFEDYRLEPVRRMVAKYGGEKFIVCGLPLETGMPLFGGMTNGLMYYLTDPGRIRAWMEAAVTGYAKTDARYASLGTDAVLWGTDYAYNGGPFLSPRVFAELIVPAAKARTKAVHDLGLPVIQHACGNNWAILDFFVEMGFDCYQSIQNSAGMDLKLLKQRYGDKLALWGGIPVEHLVSGGPDDVSRDVEYAMKWGKPGGGFIFGTSHSVAVGTRYENYLRMMEDFEKLRCY